MPHSYASIMVHVVFSTRDRKPQLDATLEERLYPYLGGILRELGGKLITVNGVEDHIHLLTAMKPTMSVAEVVGKIKGSSSNGSTKNFLIAHASRGNVDTLHSA